ncbi:cyclic nucleotide-binding domain-containing protein [Hyalangium minutum]|uniref:cAMP-binding protein n=1 Tax=Hyalangium minutum TaxID=394096 RepID=A0A085WHB4_9BACT|nr:cyclic nucleotide-binding domain-containing protein [Hyalangium minutum]KFE67077.1 cAMP-binding protein [Hyalangium minutum]
MPQPLPPLEQHPFLRGLSPEQLSAIACKVREQSFPAGALLLREGDPADTLYLVRSGKVVLEQNVPGRGPTLLETLKAGDILGLSWLFPPFRWHLDARAVESVDTFALDASCMRGPSPEHPVLEPALAMRLLRQLYDRLERVRLQRLDVYKAGA